MSQSTTFILLTTDFKPLVGGISEYLHQLFQEIAEYYPVEVWTTVETLPDQRSAYLRKQLPYLRELMSEQERERFQNLNSGQYIYLLKKYNAQQLQSILKRENLAKIEVFIGVWNLIASCWCQTLRQVGLRYSIFAYGTELISPQYLSVDRWRRTDFQQAKTIYACSQGTAHLVTQVMQTEIPINVVNPGINPDLVLQNFSTAICSWQPQLNIKTHCNQLTLLTVARLVPHKGIDLVLASMATLTAEFPNLGYWIAGNGPDQNRLQQLCQVYSLEDYVYFLGEVDELEKQALYKACDIFIMPSQSHKHQEWEGFGIVFLEAALAGKPCIGSNQGGISDAIVDNVTGFLVEAENVEAISQAIRCLLLNPNLRAEFGRQGLARVRETFTWKIIAQNFIRLHQIEVS
ncbi:glycosyltransferase family 4 protein [Thermosynechococcaceae cyanobacterium BACA0444]|uniref:Glycosyltransferase family 4 protein n=1 Tax=Pseudocalidococcus azoricus BACA0444 TaxID=2918990 RepID=A0AAE4JYI9_9CYAN|nr:glycosyltransferase family 4 protein [Pseudocalidococcus azoricus]MDS3862228.1 glycosyltransferase family 4 protein [Pseudocalidococcus azoricus BACA0444]